MHKKLAIVIPAYKSKYLANALHSLANQTCSDFTLYIGDDCSPENLEEIVDEFSGKLPVVYERFSENMGGHDLVGHWNRCISLTGKEEYIWLFSDDDIIGSRCVELFYEALKEHPGFDLYHYNVKVIDKDDSVINDKRYSKSLFPDILSASEYARKRMNNDINSFVVEYIFTRKAYGKNQGFVNFDLAWGSDDASWIAFSSDTGICTIQGDYVYWRHSESNISPNKNHSVMMRKLGASVEYIHYVISTQPSIKKDALIYWLHQLYSADNSLSWREKLAMCSAFDKKINSPLWVRFVERLISVSPFYIHR